MSADPNNDASYVLGRSRKEMGRLQAQAQLYDPFTRWLFEQAGISPGMKVLDIGSGAGDVALLAAELVGPSGAVVGVDVNAGILKTAENRARGAGLAHVSFLAGDIRAVELPEDFDAVVGRLVLMYHGDPADVVRSVLGCLKPGGIVAFEELDASVPLIARLPSRQIDKAMQWLWEVFQRGGAQVRMGFNLPETFQRAGLSAPKMQLFAPVGGGPGWAGYDYLVSTLRSILPKIIEYGIASADEVDIDTLADRLRREFENGVGMLPAHVGAWALKP